MTDWRSVSIYYNNDNVMIIPVRYCIDVGMVETKPYYICNFRDMNTFFACLLKAWEATKESITEKPNPSIMQQITGAKSWEKATKEFNLVQLQWNDDDNDVFFVLNKKHRGGFYGNKKIIIKEFTQETVCKFFFENILNH